MSLRKKGLKYVIAVLMLVSLGIASMTLISMGKWNLSIFDIVKMGFTDASNAGNAADKVVHFLVKDYAGPLAGILAMVVFATILTAALPGRYAYVVSAAQQVGVHIYTAALCMQLKHQGSMFEGILKDSGIADNKMVEGILGNKLVKGILGNAMENMGIGGLEDLGEIEIQIFPILAWVALYLVVFLLTVLGMRSGKKQIASAGKMQAMPEYVPPVGGPEQEMGQGWDEGKAAVAQHVHQAVAEHVPPVGGPEQEMGQGWEAGTAAVAQHVHQAVAEHVPPVGGPEQEMGQGWDEGKAAVAQHVHQAVPDYVPLVEGPEQEMGQGWEAGKAAVAQQGYQAVAEHVPPGNLADSAFDSDADSGFHGGIIGENGIYASKVYLMKDRGPVYFCQEGDNVLAQKDVPGGPSAGSALAEICYVAEYQEYCVKPMRRHAVFLSSGQPLGAGREYYIPRGMKIYLVDRNQTFTLA